MTGQDDARTGDVSAPGTRLTRRGALKAAAAAGALATGVGAGTIGSATAGIASFDALSVDSDNRIVDESDDPFVMRGLNVVDPKRIAVTRHLRGKTATQVVDHVTDPADGWYPRVIRVPAQPTDIGEHPNGHAGPAYFEDGDVNPDAPELENYDAIREDRRAVQPPQPPAFTREQLREYLDEYYDPVVERCRERGVYCIIDFHRHWHEQPPGTERPGGYENNLPYDSDYTNYWAYNDHDLYGDEAPASWLWVDGTYVNEHTPDHEAWAGIEDESDLPGTPYAEDMWRVNEALLEEARLFWDEVARRYADEPHVVFEPYDEPTAPGIWSPVDGCGAVKQKPLWRTFLHDFASPIVETIRKHAPEKLLLLGLPGWCQGTQGLHWENFTEAGFGNVAVTWHNYARYEVSQVHNWFNDTEYRSLDEVEAETGEELVDSYGPPPAENVGEEACRGWESYEAGGLQNAMDHHPVAVTEFGWQDRPDPSGWCRCVSRPLETTTAYGEPFLDALESDDRISWVAWAADVRWLPTMFDVPWTIEEGEIDLVNDDFYHPDSTIPTKCEDLPCEWELLDDPDMGAHVKQRLEEHRLDLVPFDTVGEPTPTDQTPESPTSPDDQWVNAATPTAIDLGWTAVETAAHYDVYLDGSVVARPTETSTVLTGLAPATTYEVGLSAVSANGVASPVSTTQMATPDGSRPSPVGDAERRPRDPDADGLYEDVNGNDEGDLADAVDLFQNRESSAVQDDADAYDFSGNDEVDLADVVDLFRENTD